MKVIFLTDDDYKEMMAKFKPLITDKSPFEVEPDAPSAATAAVGMRRWHDLCARPGGCPDLHDVGAVVSEPTRCARRRSDARQVEDGDAGEQVRH